ncbi:MAG: hypothetical protein WCT12_31980 [Verrucomicrobiota bacterium]
MNGADKSGLDNPLELRMKHNVLYSWLAAALLLLAGGRFRFVAVELSMAKEWHKPRQWRKHFWRNQ